MNNSCEIKIEIFESSGGNLAHHKIQDQVNKFIEKNVTELIDIKYSTTSIGELVKHPHFSVMLVYK